MKFVSYYGYFKFYPSSTFENKIFNNGGALNGNYLVKLNDYYTFPELVSLKNYYLQGEKILGQVECDKTMYVNEFHPEEILIKNDLYYDYIENKLIKKLEGEREYIGARENSFYLPQAHTKHKIIRGRIENNKVIIES